MNGTLLGERFVLEREIGSGGMAHVFLGRDTVLDRAVAVKVLNPGQDETDIGARFRREGRTAARLSHPNIVQVYDAGSGHLDGKQASYIVMEYVPGGDLKRMIEEKGTLLGKDLARLGAGAAAGLAHAHERGVVHRDVKPHNVLIDAYGEPKLTDFGIARALDATTTSHATRTGAYLGTTLYSAPEQLRGEKVTPKSDVYSLGITLYQAAAGDLPFVGTPMEVAGQHIHQPPVPPSEKGASIGERVEALILACLSKDPDERPTAEEVHEALRTEEGRLREPAPAPPRAPASETRATVQAPKPAPTVAPVGRSARRGRRSLLLGLAAVLLVMLGIAAYSALRGEDPNTASNAPPNNAQQEQPAAQQNEGRDPPPSGNAQPAAEPGADQQQGQGQPDGQAQQQDAQPQAGQEAPQQQQAQQPEPSPAASPQGGDNSAEPSGLTEEAAARTIEQLYQTAVSGDYDTSYGLLSQGFREREAPTQPQWSSQFETLQSLSFEEGPTAQVSGDTATVTGVTIAEHTDRTERNTATWVLVNEGGEWKLDDVPSFSTQLL